MSVTVSAEVAERLQDAAIAEHRSRAAQAAYVLATWARDHDDTGAPT